MKLKEAIKLARKRDLVCGTHYICADANGSLYLYEIDRPESCYDSWSNISEYYPLGEKYTGNKDWTDAIIQFEVE